MARIKTKSMTCALPAFSPFALPNVSDVQHITPHYNQSSSSCGIVSPTQGSKLYYTYEGPVHYVPINNDVIMSDDVSVYNYYTFHILHKVFY